MSRDLEVYRVCSRETKIVDSFELIPTTSDRITVGQFESKQIKKRDALRESIPIL